MFLVFYTKRFIDSNHSGKAIGPVIFIDPAMKEDRGLLEHELVHRKQWLRLPMIHGLLYRFSRHYRLQSEVEAYREQLKYYPTDQSMLFAKFISEKYDLDISQKEALIQLYE